MHEYFAVVIRIGGAVNIAQIVATHSLTESYADSRIGSDV